MTADRVAVQGAGVGGNDDGRARGDQKRGDQRAAEGAAGPRASYQPLGATGRHGAPSRGWPSALAFGLSLVTVVAGYRRAA